MWAQEYDKTSIAAEHDPLHIQATKPNQVIILLHSYINQPPLSWGGAEKYAQNTAGPRQQWPVLLPAHIDAYGTGRCLQFIIYLSE